MGPSSSSVSPAMVVDRFPGNRIVCRVTFAALAGRKSIPTFLSRYRQMAEDRKKKTVLLMAESDEDECLLMKDAIREVFRDEDFHCLSDGQGIMEYLLRRGLYADKKEFPTPDLILLDLDMPRKDAHQTLKQIREHPQLKAIPVVIYSTSEDEGQLEICYKLGANSYFTKPMLFEELVKTVRCLREHWFSDAHPPSSEELCPCVYCKIQNSACDTG